MPGQGVAEAGRIGHISTPQELGLEERRRPQRTRPGTTEHVGRLYSFEEVIIVGEDKQER